MRLKYVDKTHAYYLDGKRCKGVTTIAKVPDDTYNLQLWSQRQVAIGLAMAPHLVEAAAAHIDDRDKLNELCEQAKQAAGAHLAAQRGTAIHRITDRADKGEYIVPTELATKTVEAWRAALDRAGLDVVDEWVERIVVHPDLRVCGKFDRMLRRRSDGALVIADLKTGENAVRYPHSIATQLALYANAPLIAGPLPEDGGTTEHFDPMPADVDRGVAYVIHMPTPEHADVVEIDIAAGWDIVTNAVLPILEWRARTDLARTVDQRFTPVPLAQRRQHIAERCAALRSIPGAAEHLAGLWPANVPGLKSGHAHTAQQLDDLDHVVTRVEAAHQAPFVGGPSNTGSLTDWTGHPAYQRGVTAAKTAVADTNTERGTAA